MSHYNMVHKPFPTPTAVNITDAKAAVDKEWETLRKLPAWDESTVNSKAYAEQHWKARQIILQVRQPRFSQRPRDLLSWFPLEANQAPEDQREILVMEVTSEVWRRHEQMLRLSYRTQYSRTALEARTRWTTSASERLVQGTQQYRETFEESRTAQSAAGPELGRLQKRGAEFLREVRRHINDRAKFDAVVWRNRTNLESVRIQDIRRPAKTSRIVQRSLQMKASAMPPNLSRDIESAIESQKTEIQSPPRDPQSTQDSEQSEWGQPQFDSRCLCWWKCCVSRVTEAVISHPPRPGAVPTERAFSSESSNKNWLQLYATSEQFESSTCSTLFIFSYDFCADWNCRSYGRRPWLRRAQKARTNALNRQYSEVGISASKAKSLIPSLYPRAAMLWIGEVADAKDIDDLIISASFRGKPMLDFENLDFKIAASRLRKIQTVNFKK